MCAKNAHAAAVRRGGGEPEVSLDELVDEPAAEVEPGRNLDQPDTEEGADARLRVEDEEAPSTAAIAPLAPRFGTRAAADEPNSSV
jgi:hypothetical protein